MDEQQTTLDGFTKTAAPDKKVRKTKSASARRPSAADEAQIISYRHLDRRKNNPEVGVVNASTDPDTPKTVWNYDPHLDPVLQFDSSRSSIETLIDDALASGDEAEMRAALEELKRLQSPYLNWTGKAERTSFAVDTVSLHVHERMDPMSILAAVRKHMKESKAGKIVQPGLFEAPFESMPLRDAIDFYNHDRGWANRLVAGDSLLVMNSLLQKEGMAGQVQMIYFDPPYGIKYGSNFQPFVGKRDVKDRSDADLTQEPEMIKAFRDTWELGIHSYLTYLRDRLLLAKDLLSESGSIFVQISDENVHHVRELMDEVFGVNNFCQIIPFRKKLMPLGAKVLEGMCDYLIWYAKDIDKIKYRQLYRTSTPTAASRWTNVELLNGSRRKLSKEENDVGQPAEVGAKVYRLVSQRAPSFSDSNVYDYGFNGEQVLSPRGGCWVTSRENMEKLARANRLEREGDSLSFILFHKDYPYTKINNFWDDTSPVQGKTYVVQTTELAIQRCIMMTTDPGDLILDPTCGSGTTAYVAEKWGRRWITCDTSRVAVTLAKQRLVTASYDYFVLKYPHEGLKGGFIYKTVPHVTLKSIANNPDIDEIYERMHPAIDTALGELNKALADSSFRRKPESITVATTSLDPRLRGDDGQIKEWHVPYDIPADWPESARAPFDAFHKARQAMQKQMDASIAAHADQETLFDQPQPDKKKLRITGPFTVEAVPFPTVLALDEAKPAHEADVAIARSGESARQHQWRDELLTTGIRGKGGQMLRFAELETLPTGENFRHLHAAVILILVNA